jgi:acyl carrier protein
MYPDSISEKVIETFRRVFPNERNIGHTTTVDDIGNWDSLNHITLILELEKQFEVRFDLFEIIELRDVRGIIEYIASRMNK